MRYFFASKYGIYTIYSDHRMIYNMLQTISEDLRICDFPDQTIDSTTKLKKITLYAELRQHMLNIITNLYTKTKH